MNENDLVRIGLMTKARGLRGEVSVMPLTGDPERFRRLEKVFVEKPFNAYVNVESVRYHRDQIILKLEGCDDANAAGVFRGSYISVTRDELIPLKKDSYFVFDLVGCMVYGDDGALLGELADVLETGSNDVYVVKTARQDCAGRKDHAILINRTGPVNRADPETCAETVKSEILIPALKSVVREVDIGNKRVTVNIRGLYAD